MRNRWLVILRWGILGLTILLANKPLPVAAQEGIPGRPKLPNEETYSTEHFLIHFTRTGEDAVDPTDTNGDNVPDYIEHVAEALEINWQTQIVEFGWAPPPTDGGQGGSNQLDVYLENLMDEGIAGYTDSEGGFVGDNPLTTETERYASFSYMSIDNDFIEVADFEETPLDLMEATVAHEFNHAIQAGYDNADSHFWLYEATATWMEQEVFEDAKNGIYYLDALFDNVDTCIVASAGGQEDADHWYAEWLFIRYLSETYNSELIRTIWEQMRQMDGFDAVDTVLAPYGSSMQEAARDFAIANLLRDYEEGYLYPVVRLEGEAGIGTFTPTNGVQSLGVDYVRLTGSGQVTIQLRQGSDTPMSLLVVGLTNDQAQEIAGEGKTATVNLALYQETFILVYNGEQIVDEHHCYSSDYVLEIATSSGPTSPVTKTWSIVNYQAPSTEYTPIGDYEPPVDLPFAQEETAETLEVSFEPLIPTSLPAGYTFVYAYTMTEEDFGDELIYYVPGGGESANYDYQTDSGGWLSVSESPSPYATLEEWLVDIDYDTPGDLFAVDGVDVLSEDLSDRDEVWISVTLIYQDLFIVVDATREDGDVSTAENEALTLVRALIQAGGGAPIPEAAETEAVETEPVEAAPTEAVETEPVEAAPVESEDRAEAVESDPVEVAPVESEVEAPPQGNNQATLIGVGLIVVGFGACIMAIPVALLGIFLWLRGRKR